MSARRRERSAEEERTEVDSEEEGEDDEDLEEAMRKAACAAPRRKASAARAQQHVTIPKIPEAVDDFLRNFLRRAGLSRTLSSFEAEWYGSAHSRLTQTLSTAAGPGGTGTGTGTIFISDALTHKQLLHTELQAVRKDTDLLRQEVLAAGESLVCMQRERDFHRLQYRRVTEDKHRLMEDYKQLRTHLLSYKPALKHLEHKYKEAVNQKMLLSIDKHHVQNPTRYTTTRVNEEESPIRTQRNVDRSPAQCTTHPKDTQFPACSRMVKHGPVQVDSEQWKRAGSLSLSCSIKAHQLPISCIDLHPRKLILASASSDRSWRLWALPVKGEKVGQMVLTGEGHSDWLSSCSFHPDGAKLATTSGDTTVRLWDFSRGRCVLTLSGHSQPTWGCSFHWSGHFLASCSADRTARVWDLNSQRCRLTLRRHTASVNSVCFLPASNLLLSCSADRTLALWDARLGVCTATFHGHQHPCNHAATTSLQGAVMASCDTSGVINLWDVRKPASAMATVDAGPMAANQVAFSLSGKMLAVASGDGVVRVVEVDSCAVSSLSGGHSDDVQSVTFDHKGETVMSAGSDGVIHVWS